MKEVYSVGPSILRHRKFRSAPNVTAGALWLQDSLAPGPRGATSASPRPSLAAALESRGSKEATPQVLLELPCSSVALAKAESSRWWSACSRA